jgi:putative ABC transport system permease protein
MIAGDALHLALRTTLTTLGVAIGIASLAGMVSLGVGLQDQLIGGFLKSGMFDAITVLPARSSGGRGFGGRGFGRRGPLGALRDGGESSSAAPDRPAPPLDDSALNEIRGFAQVTDVYPNLRAPVDLTLDRFSELTSAIGVPMSSRGEGVFQSLAYGSFFTGDNESQCVLSLDLAKRITDLGPGNLIGRTVSLAYPGPSISGGGGLSAAAPRIQIERVEAVYTIIGIVEQGFADGVGLGSAQADLMIPLGKARAIRTTDGNGAGNAQAFYPSLTVKVKRAQDTGDVENQLKETGYTALSLNDALQGAKRAFIVLDIALSLIGSIALTVSSLGIVNTMVMSILERTREIGIMKAIGGSDADIRRIFLVEAATLGLAGGLVGVTLGWLVGRVINFGANLYIRSQGGTPGNLFALPLWLIAGSIGFSLIVSLIAGSFPAARAARLDPVQALRHD